MVWIWRPISPLGMLPYNTNGCGVEREERIKFYFAFSAFFG